MATYFVDSGMADDTGNGLRWDAAKKTLAAALALATGDTDIVVVKSTHQENFGTDTVLTFAGNIRLITATADDAATAYTPAAMGTGGWIGNDTTSYYVRMAGSDKRVHVWGLTIRTSGAGDSIAFGSTSSGADQTYENCYFWGGTTATSFGAFAVGLGGPGAFRFINSTFRFGATSQYFEMVSAAAEFIGCSISSDGSTPSTLISGTSNGGSNSVFRGCNLSLIAGTLVGNVEGAANFIFDRCRFHATTTPLASQTSNPTGDSAKVTVLDCSSDSTDLKFGYYDAYGSVILDTGIYFTSTDAELIGTDDAPDPVSWKIVANTNTKLSQPFRTPWISVYHSGTSAITPYLEILRDGSATAFKNDEVWAEVMAKTTADYSNATFYDDFAGIGVAGSDQSAGAGTGSWSGENATAWSGKIDAGESITPAEPGDLSMRICAGNGSAITIYVDPQIRT